MLQGMHSAAAGMAAQQQRIDSLANDLANVSTAGYKRVRVSFRDLVYTDAGPTSGPTVRSGAGAAVASAGRGFGQGSLVRTDSPLDVAIEGPGFLRVRREDGSVGLTRDGALKIGADGRLMTGGGQRIEPAITLPRGIDDSQVEIAADGTVAADGRRLGRLTVVNVPSPQGLIAVGDNLFAPSPASGAVRTATGARIEQGVLESSNVQMADAMVEMMDAQRSFQLASKAISVQDQMLEIANGVKR